MTEKRDASAAYRELTQMPAWKDLVQFIESEKELSIKRLDDKDAKDVTAQEYCEARGYRKGLDAILRQAEFRMSGV